jgi:RAMP superfamily
VAEFINPYTFVPLPAAIARSEPAGHHLAKPESISGRVTVEWTLQTPLLLPLAHSSARDGRIVVPGSSVKGAIRSLHETLMGGCLRVVDEDFVPVYREPAVAKGENWHMALVTGATRKGRATQVQLTSQTVWVRAGTLRSALGRVPCSGDTVDIAEWAVRWRDGLGRDEVHAPDGVTAGDGWAVIVGDSGTRLRSREFFCAAGQIPAEDSAPREVAASAWLEFERLCEGTNDIRLIRQRPDATSHKGWRTGRIFADVHWPGRADLVGRRRRITGRLWPGDVVWARVNADSGQVDRLSMAAIWRAPGEGPVSGRIPDSVRTCQDPGNLCLSCRLFGSADVATAEAGQEATQLSYAGHLRIGDAVADRVTTVTVRLAPLGSPRPGAGQFYLQIDDDDPASGEDELPTANWGSEHDRPTARPVRGRKFYWHGDPTKQATPRHVARRGQQNEAMTGERQLVPAGAVFRQEITFDNVSPAELGSLLLTLLPRLLLPRTEGKQTADYWLRLGGGKPLGLGSCAVTVTDLRWQDARQRYLGQDTVSQRAEDFFAPLACDVARLAGHPVLRYWPTLSRVLRADAVDPALIWYPLGGEWGDETNRDRAFRFFSRTNGRYLARSREPVVALPDPDPAKNLNQRLRTAQRRNP